MKRTLLGFLCWVGICTPQVIGQSTLPVEKILLDLGQAPEAVVREIAAEQAREQWKIDRGPLYKSAPKDRNKDPNEISDEKFFSGILIPLSPQTKLALFSDDGCEVWIDGVPVLTNFKKGQHLPDIKQSFHVLTKFKPVAGRMYHIRIHYSNTIYNGKTDIDGCTLFAFGGGVQKAGVNFLNKTRGGDLVVSAKDDELKTPGGIKEVTVQIVAAGKEAILTLKQDAKNTGTASFDKDKNVTSISTSKLEKTKDGFKLIIYGRNLSKKPRDVSIEATIDGKPAGSWQFTVFAVKLMSVITGDPAKEISPLALTEGGSISS